MKNKHLLKVLSIGALSSLLVTPLVLNGVSDSVEEEAITENADESQKSVKRAIMQSNGTYLLDSKMVTHSLTFFYGSNQNKLFSPDYVLNETISFTNNSDFLNSSSIFGGKGNAAQISLSLSSSKTLYKNFTFFSGLDANSTYNFYSHITESDVDDTNIMVFDISYDDFCTNVFAIYEGNSAKTMQYLRKHQVSVGEYVDYSDDAEKFDNVASATGSTDYLVVMSHEVLGISEPFTLNYAVKEIFNSGSVDTTEPVVTASKYAISLPVKTSTRLTKEYLLNQKIFKVTDDTDGDITDRLVIESGDINYDKIGTYPLVLSWSDVAGNKSTLTFNVLIGDFEKPTYTIKQSTMYVECPSKLSEADLLSNVTFSDNYDTSVTKSIVTNNYNQNTNCGTYSVTIRGTDTSGNYTDATFNVCVRDTIAPTITGVTNNQVLKTATISVTDSGSGVKSVTIDGSAITLSNGQFTFNASGYSDGEHTLIATDNQGNPTTIKFVSDKTAPKITGIDSSTRLNKSVTITLADTYSNIVSFKLNGTLIEVNAKTKEITLGVDNLVQGTNKITELKDSLGNVASDLSFIYDTKAPVITPNVEGGGSIKSGDYITAEQVKAQFTATDEVDGNCTITVVSSTIVDKVGKYVVTLRAVDKTGNATEISVNVERLDVTAPVIFIKSSDDITIMKVASGTEITYENLLNIFMYLYQDKVNTQDCSIEVLSDGFVANGTESQVIRYMVTNNVTGEATMYSLDYQSYEFASDDKKDDNKTDDDKKDDNNNGDSDNDNTTDDKKENWFVRAFKGVGNFFKKIWNFISGLFGGNKDNDVKTTDKVETSENTPDVVIDDTDVIENNAKPIVW